MVLALTLIAAAVPAMASYSMVAKKNTTLYADAFLLFPVGAIPKYAVVKTSSVVGGVAKLKVGGKTVYAKRKNLVSGPQIIKKAHATWGLELAKSGYVYAYPSGAAAKRKVSKGTTFYAVGHKNGWGMVVSGSGRYVGYVKLP